MEKELLLQGGQVSGYGLANYYPPMMVAAATTFWNAFSNTQDTPARKAAHASYAALSYELGCRTNPLTYNTDHLYCLLNKNDFFERAILALAAAVGGRLEIHLSSSATWSQCHHQKWINLAKPHFPLWQGNNWQTVKKKYIVTQKHHDRILMKAGICDVSHLCNTAGNRFITNWAEQLNNTPDLALYPKKQAQLELNAIISALTDANISPQRSTPTRSLTSFVSTQSTLTTNPISSQNMQAKKKLLANTLSGDGGTQLRSLLLTSTGSHPESVWTKGWEALMGDSNVISRPVDSNNPDAESWGEQITNQINIDGGTRRDAFWYKKALDPDERTWTHKISGGAQDANMNAHDDNPDPGWNEDPQKDKWTIGADGWLIVPPLGGTPPPAILFWLHCESTLKQHDKQPDQKESQFILNKLVTETKGIDNPYIVTTDGTRKPADPEHPTPRVARVSVAWHNGSLKTYGGEMELLDGDFERHSYETELQAFGDALQDAPLGSQVFIITDCLSGTMALSRFRGISCTNKAKCYRAPRLQHVLEMENRHKRVAYIWCHSHVGITPNEAADIMADKQLGQHNEPPSVDITFQVATLKSIKRSVGEMALLAARVELLGHLNQAVCHTIVASNNSWNYFKDESVKGQRVHKLTEEDRDALQDLRSDRAGLWDDRNSRDGSRHSFAKYMTRKTGHLGTHALGTRRLCSCGQEIAQTRWHTLVDCQGCPDGRTKDLRAQQTVFMNRNKNEFDNTQAEAVFDTLTEPERPRSNPEKIIIETFLSGLPHQPSDPQNRANKQLASNLGRNFYKNTTKLLADQRSHNQKEEEGDNGKAWRLRKEDNANHYSRSEWWNASGH
jgi:ribonuclease HI